ncbi:hypothetical protein, conserved [Eimeria praecox]|uniref:Uncharacterized protein n=1 Tax=Eimeria praecox TaxID=51316 RepID=U6H3V3_9EIME|nr:hypothetical protein, conserved [Eimeria praecox]
MSNSDDEGVRTERSSPSRVLRTPSSQVDSSSSSSSSSNNNNNNNNNSSSSSNTGRPKLTPSQRICQLLLERHGSRITQLLLQNEEGRRLLEAFLALSFSPAEQEGSNCLVHIIKKDPETLLPLLLKKSGNKDVARGLSACLVQGISNTSAEELKPVIEALSQTILEPLREQADAQKKGEKATGQTTQAAGSAASGEPRVSEESSDKRADDEANSETLLKRPSRVQELIREQQRRCQQQQQQQQQLLRQRSSNVRDSVEGSQVSQELSGGKTRSLHEKLLIDALIFAASQPSSSEAENLCEKLVNFAPAVLTQVIKIEVSRNTAEPTPPSSSPTAAASADTP